MSKELLEAERALAEKKAAHIAALLAERVKLNLSTVKRLSEIAEELKALGHRAPRGPNKAKTEPVKEIRSDAEDYPGTDPIEE